MNAVTIYNRIRHTAFNLHSTPERLSGTSTSCPRTPTWTRTRRRRTTTGGSLWWGCLAARSTPCRSRGQGQPLSTPCRSKVVQELSPFLVLSLGVWVVGLCGADLRCLWVQGFLFVCLFVFCFCFILVFFFLVGCLTSQQHASVSQGRICLDNFTCCHTKIQVADQTFYLTQSQYSDTGPTSPSAGPITPGP